MGELVIGIVVVLFCALIYFNSGDFPEYNESVMGAGSYPKLIAGVLAFLSIILIVKKIVALIRNGAKRSNTSVSSYIKSFLTEYKIVLYVVGLLALYIFLMDIVGYIVMTLIFIVATGLIIGSKRKKDVLVMSVISVIVTFGMYFFFENALNVRFPSGIFFN
ncbi:hypothetical protein CEY16_07985 [Halalkalibacillus sediminis]|uniref:DUF1468 domain-containing protein n=1 Tax=Halalkalibacillus sediminis TaxID=2018042 RepID=A0A2I0QUT9_9BACI|nr:tripartite tricarboxylate transporter TctB family protein [Halalkalibacillus sediminis]PKR77860.1 hypothetical protein CEY16_07985 [Halalkalibacillus sediminis]